MIRPDEIRRKAENLYPEFLTAWLSEEQFFPRTIRVNRDLDPTNHAVAVAAIELLRQGSKQALGFGYTIEWRERRSRAFGRNPFPSKFYFETEDDYLRFIGKKSEFQAFASAVLRLRSEFPELNKWIRSHRRLLIDVEPDLDGLLHVLRFLRANPRPGLFARELPLPVDTKLIDRNERLLRHWLDLVLPPESICSDETHFGRRYGFRYAEIHAIIRLLDPDLQTELNCQWNELSLPISALAELPVRDVEVILVENKVSLLVVPARRRTIGLGALGWAAPELRRVKWLAAAPITYWGDIDADGFEILSAVRREFPQVRSVLMDNVTMMRRQSLLQNFIVRHRSAPPHLTPDEMEAFARCLTENLRLEQEHLPIDDVNDVTRQL